jgi:hypothetical protein
MSGRMQERNIIEKSGGGWKSDDIKVSVGVRKEALEGIDFGVCGSLMPDRSSPRYASRDDFRFFVNILANLHSVVRQVLYLFIPPREYQYHMIRQAYLFPFPLLPGAKSTLSSSVRSALSFLFSATSVFSSTTSLLSSFRSMARMVLSEGMPECRDVIEGLVEAGRIVVSSSLGCTCSSSVHPLTGVKGRVLDGGIPKR